jgi:Zn-dependent alcohol dehydrogenase
MRAALLEASGKPLAIVDDVDIEAPRTGEVVVRVVNCGVCHSDVSQLNGTFEPPMPIVLGHEAGGIVEDVGPGVTGLSPGDKVMLTPCPPCGVCYWCVRGEHSVCHNASAITTNTFPDGGTRLSRHGQVVYRGIGLGAWAEYVIVQETGAVKVEDDTPLDIACVIGCSVQTGVGAVFNTARVEEGSTVLVMGLGGIGMSIVQGARLAGATRIIVSDPVASRRDAAAAFGATDAIDPTSDDVMSEVLRITGVGVDYAFDAAGRASLVQTGMFATRNGGTTVIVGAGPLDDTVTFPPVLMTITEKKLLGCLLGSCNSQREIPRLLALWRAGRLDLEAMVTARRPLAEVNEAVEDLEAGRGIRTVLAI